MSLRQLFLIIAAVLFLIAGLRGDTLIGWGLLFLTLSLLVGERTWEWLSNQLGRR
jgi:hypothetical protein